LIAHYSDTHLGRVLYRLGWTRDEIIEHFRLAVEKALAEHVDAIIFSGDVFDEPRPFNVVIREASKILREASDKGVRIYSILGEHDTPRRRDVPPQELIPYIRVLGYGDRPFVDCFNKDGYRVCVGGVSNVSLRAGSDLKNKLLERINRAVYMLDGYRNVLMLHQNIVNFFMLEPGIDINEIPVKPNYVAMGHLHWRIKHYRDNQALAYPGSLDILSINEYESWKRYGKGFYIVDLSGDQPIIHDIDVPVLSLEKITATSSDLYDKIMSVSNKLPRDRNTILYVEIELNSSEKEKVDLILTKARRALSERGYMIYIYDSKKYRDIEIAVSEEAVEPAEFEKQVVVEMVKNMVRGKYSEEVVNDFVEKILLIKDTAIRGEEGVDEILEGLLKNPISREIVPEKLISINKVEVAKTTSNKVSGRKSGGDLLSYLGS